MDYVEHLGYQYRMLEFDSDEAFDDFFTGKTFCMLCLGITWPTTGYRSTQLVIVKHITIQSSPLIAHHLEQWLTLLVTTTTFSECTLVKVAFSM